jgi:TolA-binding protein
MSKAIQTPAAEQLAQALRNAPHTFDEMTRARTERNLVEAWRVRGAHVVPHDVPMPRSRGQSRTVWMGSLAVSAALGVVLGVLVLRGSTTAVPRPENVAHFDLVIGGGAVQSGIVVAGQVLESGKHGHIEVALAQTRLDIAPDSRVRFEQLDDDEVRLALVQGRVDVAFHPARKGQQQLSVETAAARVVVVGTRFAVEADATRSTRVSVSEGIVRVEPRRGTESLLVHAGEQVLVPAEPLPSSSLSVVQPVAMPEPPRAADVALGIDPVASLGAESDGLLSLAKSDAARRRPKSSRGARAELKLEGARQMLLEGKHGEARERLQRIVPRSSLPMSTRVEALTLMAESFTAQGQVPRAAAAYRQAVEIAPRDTAGHNALFALARLLDRYTHDNVSAAAAYREYLAKAPHGALASQAQHALCRLSINSSSCRTRD